jgi:hypothetical protein
MSAWLLFLRQHAGALWRTYMSLLPAPGEATCLLNFQSGDDVAELQLPELKREAEVQARWWVRRPSCEWGGPRWRGAGGGGACRRLATRQRALKGGHAVTMGTREQASCPRAALGTLPGRPTFIGTSSPARAGPAGAVAAAAAAAAPGPSSLWGGWVP